MQKIKEGFVVITRKNIIIFEDHKEFEKHPFNEDEWYMIIGEIPQGCSTIKNMEDRFSLIEDACVDYYEPIITIRGIE